MIMEQELLKMALEAINLELQKEPENAILYKERGRLRNLLGDEKGAMEDLREALQRDPSIAKEWENGQFEGKIGGCH